MRCTGGGYLDRLSKFSPRPYADRLLANVHLRLKVSPVLCTLAHWGLLPLENYRRNLDQ